MPSKVQKCRIKCKVSELLADKLAPITIYERLRDQYPNTILLESADFQPNESCWSYICVQPVASFIANGTAVQRSYPNGLIDCFDVDEPRSVQNELDQYVKSFELEDELPPGIENGLFGYISYDAIQYFEDIELNAVKDEERAIPTVYYQLFRFVLAFNHYRDELYLVENLFDGVESSESERLVHTITNGLMPDYPFRLAGEGSSNFTEEEYGDVIRKCKEHIHRGDVFQIVPSRRFAQPYAGDEFKIYRALRVINPSPYLFYFDFGSFQIFGSSPEAQLVVSGDTAILYPIAGTYRRTGDDEEDAKRVEELKADPKESAEHVMLVDLARNDLSKHCENVRVHKFKEIKHYSHVIHLVSDVRGDIISGANALTLLADTFPMGTLSGAPKYRAMELIDKYERGNRGFYGGAIGIIDFSGDSNHAIMIRTFMSKDRVLYRQAGGGVVADSVPESEVQESLNKLMALKAALEQAEGL